MNKIAIYGVGAFGMLFFQTLQGKIDFFIDDFSKSTQHQGIPLKKLSELSKDTKIYISILQHSKKIERELQNKGFTNVINFTQAICELPNILELIADRGYLWLVKDTNRMINEDKLQKLHSLLKDDISKNILTNIIMLRKTLDTQYYIKPKDTEYFPSDIPITKNLTSINFIDCGAYTGDTIEELMQQNIKINTALSFEPDTKNLTRLQNRLSVLRAKHSQTNFFIYPAGVYSKNNILKFSNSGIDSSASFDSNSDIEVPVIALDSVILNANPNFIKMDIEGAETEALIGATKTIKKYKPNLAICLYHKPEDLWEIPLLIQEIEPSYDMYIRVHEDMCLSTVLYCIPRSL